MKLEIDHNNSPTFTIGRQFQNKTQLRRWVLGYIHTTEGKLNVLTASHDTTPENNDYIPLEQQTRTTIEQRLQTLNLKTELEVNNP